MVETGDKFGFVKEKMCEAYCMSTRIKVSHGVTVSLLYVQKGLYR